MPAERPAASALDQITEIDDWLDSGVAERYLCCQGTGVDRG